MGTRLFFTANGELWVHDTTSESSWQVADICSGVGWCNSNPGSLTVMDTRLYFRAYHESIGHYHLWMMEIEDRVTYD
jgi:ELWxxDGT repeat protein